MANLFAYILGDGDFLVRPKQRDSLFSLALKGEEYFRPETETSKMITLGNINFDENDYYKILTEAE